MTPGRDARPARPQEGSSFRRNGGRSGETPPPRAIIEQRKTKNEKPNTLELAPAATEAAEAAWLIAQHAIGEPDFMRRCRDLVDEASACGRIPRWQFAYLDDRIRVFEGKAQRFGTQLDLRPEGPGVLDLEDPESVDTRRAEAGLPDLAATLARAQGDPLPTPIEYATRQAEGLAWRRRVGWIA
jgi:hypothetical protein